ncbi:MAG: copper amine oxidase N-terminal domain-containing protein [Intestinibacillus sp.]
MKHSLKRALAACLAAVLAICALPCAFAADKPIQVVLDGQTLAFEAGVEPVIKDGRTFVPFRAIFEAMGAEVGWDAATKTVSAQRGGVQVRFVVGQQTVTVTENGSGRTLRADAAPFLSAAGKTLVPVRFAAQALGAAVGWDASTRTVLLVDVEKLRTGVTETYAIMNRYLAFASPSGVQAVNGSVSLNLTLGGGNVKVPVQVSFDGLWSGGSGTLTVRFEAETTLLTAALKADSTQVDSGLAELLTSLNGVRFDCILNQTEDALYLKSDALTGENIPAGAWVRLPLDRTLGLLTGGRLNAAMLRAAAQHDFAAYALAQAQGVSLTSSAADNVAAVRDVLEAQAKRYGDSAFMQTDKALTASSGSEADGTSATLRLLTDGDAIVSAESSAQLVQDTQVIYQQAVTRDANGKTAVSVVIGAESYQAELSGEFTLTPSDETPVLLPQGKVVPE